ncbi:MAG: ABC transporter ATP-binding protein [Thioalkalispiraceae bacterium]|jgi:ABC-2 type transport system ATP-binding protein
MSLALSITGLHKTFPKGTQALKGVDLEVREGDFFALLGPNGAGKSTTIGIVCSLINKTAGKVEVFGHDIDTAKEAAKSCIGLVPQEFNFNQFEPVGEIVINQAGYYGIERKLAARRAEKYLKELNLWDRRKDMARELSGGMKRRLMIARALVHEPKLLILDEPTAGVDIEIRRSMWVFLKEVNQQGTTIILTTHYLEEAENLCKHIAIINNGLTIESTEMKQLLTRLHTETFILNLALPILEAPVSDQYPFFLLDETTLEVTVDKEKSINDVFTLLSEKGINVISMRNKSNRLEEMFLQMVEQGAL